MRLPHAFLVPILAVALLSACTGAPSSSAPSGSGPGTTEDALVVRSTGLTLQSDGEATTWEYVETPISEVVDGLTDLLGAPQVAQMEAWTRTGTATSYGWDGLTLLTEDETAEVPVDQLAPGTARWTVVIDGVDANGVPVESAAGIIVGTAFDDVPVDSIVEVIESEATPENPAYRAVLIDPTTMVEPSDGLDEAMEAVVWRVALVGQGDAVDRVQRITAPDPSRGA